MGFGDRGRTDPGPSDFGGKDFWAGLKEVKQGDTDISLVRIPPLRRPTVLTVDVMSDVARAAFTGQRESVFTMQIGIGRLMVRKRIGGPIYTPADIIAATLPANSPQVRSGRETFVAQTLEIFTSAGGIIDPDTGPQTWKNLALVGIGTGLPRLHQDWMSFGSGGTTVAQSAIDVLLVAGEPWAREERRGLWVRNKSAANLYLGFGAAVASVDSNVKILPNERWESPLPVYQGDIFGLWDAAGAGKACIEVQTQAERW